MSSVIDSSPGMSGFLDVNVGLGHQQGIANLHYPLVIILGIKNKINEVSESGSFLLLHKCNRHIFLCYIVHFTRRDTRPYTTARSSKSSSREHTTRHCAQPANSSNTSAISYTNISPMWYHNLFSLNYFHLSPALIHFALLYSRPINQDMR